MNVSGVILSGGKSSRMGRPKSFLPLGDRTVIEQIAAVMEKFDELLIIANDQKSHAFLNYPTYKDAYTDKGPLAGIEAALSNCSYEMCALTACDTPFVDSRVYDTLISHMAGHDAVIPVFNDRMHPLSGIYRKSALPIIRKQLAEDQLKIRDFFDYIDTQYVSVFPDIPEDAAEKHFFNMNTPEEYENARAMFKL